MNFNSQTIESIAVDWGTTHVRAYALGRDKAVIAETQSAKGMGVLSATEFEAALLELVESWLPESGSIDIVACGMVSSRQGWQEAPYLKAPCSPFALQSLTTVAAKDSRLHFQILPGVSQAVPADVMRGEETQIAGLLAHLAKSQDGEESKRQIICLPGTHTKWVEVNNGVIERFATMMTGEMFSLLTRHSILKHDLADIDTDLDSGQWDQAAFLEAVQAAVSQPEKFSSSVFSLRAEILLNDMSPAAAKARLSGLLIGLELAGTKDYWAQATVSLIGDNHLMQLYCSALSLVNIPSQRFDAKDMTLQGLAAVTNALAENKL
jgi:2-dehydro-3-deoxygalactonokinase